MATQVRIIAGPARSGKTTVLLAEYRSAICGRSAGDADGNGVSQNIDAGLWLSPTRHAASDIRQRLITGGLRGCFSPAVYTLEQFAEMILAMADDSPQFLGRSLKRQLIQRLITEANSERRLQYFAPIAETAGLVELVADFISDLKRHEITVARYSELAETMSSGEKNRELAGLYEKYQGLLDEHQWFDAEQRFQLAADWLLRQPSTEWGALANLRLVVIDGFTDFTAAQYRLIDALVKQVDKLAQLVVTLPLESGTSRDALFHKSKRTLAELQSRHRIAKVEWTARTSEDGWPAFGHMERYLFDNPRQLPDPPAVDRIEIVATAGRRAEIEMLARRVKELFVVGDERGARARADAAGARAIVRAATVRTADIAIVFRNLETVAPLVEEVFEEYGIPVSIDWRARLIRAPILRALVGVLQLQASDWPYRQLLAVIANNFFRPLWLEWRDGSARIDTEWAVRELQIARGQRALLSAIGYRATTERSSRGTTADGDPLDSADAQNQDEQRMRFRVASGVLARLADALPGAEWQHSMSQWIGILDGLVDKLGLLAAGAATQSFKSDEDTWKACKDALVAAAQFDERIGETRLSLTELIDRLQSILSVEPLPVTGDDIGRIRVLSAASVRALEVPYLFVAGLSEKEFPRPAGDGRLFTDAEYQRLRRSGGIRFPTQHDRACDEMLLFYEVVTRACRQLVLSYPGLDESAQPLSPSPYLLELGRCLNLATRAEISLSPVPQYEPYSATERRLRVVARLRTNDAEELSELLAKRSSVEENLVAGLRAIAARDDRTFGAYEGIFAGNAAKARLAAAFGPEHCWSVSRLEEYAYCPFRFFARNVLKLEPLAELSLQTDYGRRGLLAHEALAELHRRLNGSGAPGLPSKTSPEEYARYRSETITLLQEQLAHGDPLEVALRTIDLTVIGQWLEEYLGQHERYESTSVGTGDVARPELRPAHFEVSFGLKRRGGEQVDELSTETPFDVVYGDERIRLSGRIDRIDIGLVGDRVVFNVLDYKTGRNKKLKADDIQQGLALQLPLYALAVQELLMIDRRAVPWRVGYWYLRDSGFQSHDLPQLFQSTPQGLCETGEWQTLKVTLLERVVQMVQGIRGGDFPVYSQDPDCTGRCEFHTVCRVGQVRTINKRWGSAAAAEQIELDGDRKKAAPLRVRATAGAEAKEP